MWRFQATKISMCNDKLPRVRICYMSLNLYLGEVAVWIFQLFTTFRGYATFGVAECAEGQARRAQRIPAVMGRM